jgi:hypothetical protein
MAMLAPMKMKCAARKTRERGRKRFMAVWASAMRSPHYYACKEQSEG